eukprot:5514192-Pyramimonas_sp.AAC.1
MPTCEGWTKARRETHAAIAYLPDTRDNYFNLLHERLTPALAGWECPCTRHQVELHRSRRPYAIPYYRKSRLQTRPPAIHRRRGAANIFTQSTIHTRHMGAAQQRHRPRQGTSSFKEGGTEKSLKETLYNICCQQSTKS